MMKLVVLLLTVVSATALAGPNSAQEYEQELQKLYGYATGQDAKVTPDARMDAAEKYFWMSKARTLCDYKDVSMNECLSALLFDDRFDPKRFCVGSIRGKKNRCQADGAVISKSLDALEHDREGTHGKAADLNALAKRVAERALKEQAAAPNAQQPGQALPAVR